VLEREPFTDDLFNVRLNLLHNIQPGHQFTSDALHQDDPTHQQVNMFGHDDVVLVEDIRKLGEKSLDVDVFQCIGTDHVKQLEDFPFKIFLVFDLYMDSHFLDKVDQAIGIFVDKSTDKILEEYLIGQQHTSHSTKVQKTEFAIRCNQDIARMGIGMEKTMFQYLCEEQFQSAVYDVLEV